MDKVIRDGKVAVLYSPGFGSGWYSWNRELPTILFDPVIVDLVIKKCLSSDIVAYCHKKYGEQYCFLGAEDLKIKWIEQGTRFIIREYDGNETILLEDDLKWIIA